MMTRKIETTNNALVQTMLVNRGFSSYRINANSVPAETVQEWHKLLDELHGVAYHVASHAYNTDGEVDYSPVYNVLGKVWKYLGEINGGKLRSDSNTALVVCSKATREAIKKSAELQYVYSQKSNSMRYLSELESTNGAEESTIAKVKNDIEKYDAQIEEMKTVYGNQYKQFAKCSASVFYKAMEDFIADMVEERLTMTEEEVQAEAEAKRKERRAKTAAKRAK